MKISHCHFAEIDSTNTWGKQHAHELEQDKLTLITAEVQTGGRGRQGRFWLSPKGQNIYASFCLFVKDYTLHTGNITLVLALSAIHVLEKYGFHPKIKWPNDLMLSEKKVGGVMCETSHVNALTALILGIGINVNMPEELLNSLGRPATSLMIEGNRPYDLNEIIQNIAHHFSKEAERFLKEGFKPFLDDYKQHIMHKPRDSIKFHISAHNPLKVAFHSIQEDGSINLQMPDGAIRNFYSGEII